MTIRTSLLPGSLWRLLASLSATPITLDTPASLNEGVGVVSANGIYVEGLNLQDNTSSLVDVTINGVTLLGGSPRPGRIQR